MVTIAYITEEIVKNRPYLQEAIDQRIINYGALAEQIKPEIELILKKNVKTSAIMMSLRRLADKIEFKYKNKLKFDLETDITLKSDLIEFVVPRTKSNEQKIKQLKLNLKNRDFYSTILGMEQINIITNKRYKERIQRRIDEIDHIFKDLGAITLTISMSVFEQSGFFYLLTRSLAWEDISIVELVSTMTELTFIIDQKDMSRAYEALKKTIEQHS